MITIACTTCNGEGIIFDPTELDGLGAEVVCPHCEDSGEIHIKDKSDRRDEALEDEWSADNDMNV